jgi:hypothetical protein
MEASARFTWNSSMSRDPNTTRRQGGPRAGPRAGPFVCALALSLLAACPEAEGSGPAPHPVPPPPGTAFVLNGVAVLGPEIDEIASDFALIEPQNSILQLRRLAIGNVVVPRIAAAGIDPVAREATRGQAESYRASIASGSLPPGPLLGPMEMERSGDFSKLGFAIWSEAFPLREGASSEVFETPGCFHVLRVKSRKEGSLPARTGCTIGLFNFPYVDLEPASVDIANAIDRSRITFLDEAWRDAVPAALRFRLHAENP